MPYDIRHNSAGDVAVYSRDNGAEVAVVHDGVLYHDEMADLAAVLGMIPPHSESLAALGLDAYTIEAIVAAGKAVGTIR